MKIAVREKLEPRIKKIKTLPALPAVLIPLIWWSNYLVSRRMVTGPILGLINAAAEEAGYYPVPSRPQPVPETVQVFDVSHERSP